jgi:hypothetical protein
MYGPVSKLEKKAPNQSNRPIFVGKLVQNQKIDFMLFWDIRATPNGPKKVQKGLQVDGIYALMS